MKLIKEREIYLDKKRLLRQMRQIEVVQYDSGVQLVFNVMDFEIPSGTTATIYFQKPSGESVFQECNTSVEENKITIDVENQAFTEYGFVNYQVKLIKDSSVISSFIGNIAVEKSLADANAEESKTVISPFDKVVGEKIAEIEKAANENNLATSIICEASGEAISITDSSDRPLKGLKVFGKTTQNGTPTPTAPIDLVSVENPIVKIMGKNLLENNAKSAATAQAVTFTVNSDRTVTANGTATDNTSLPLRNDFHLAKGTYILSGGISTNARVDFRSTRTDGSYKITANSGGETIVEVTDNDIAGSFRVYIYVLKGAVLNNVVLKPMLRPVTITDDTYEPYKAQAFSVPYTLNEGDYVDFEKGVYVSSRTSFTFNGNASEYWAMSSGGTRIVTDKIANSVVKAKSNADVVLIFSEKVKAVSANNTYSGIEGIAIDTTGRLSLCLSNLKGNQTISNWTSYLSSNPIIISYPLAEPVETPLTAEELEAFKALHSYKPNTVIQNDKGAEMSVAYCADTKLYIDNKFTALNNAILNSVQ